MTSKEKITNTLCCLLDAAEQGKMPEHEAAFIFQALEARFEYLRRKQPTFYDDLLEAIELEVTSSTIFGSN